MPTYRVGVAGTAPVYESYVIEADTEEEACRAACEEFDLDNPDADDVQVEDVEED